MLTLIVYVFVIVFVIITIYFSMSSKSSRNIIAKIEPDSEIVNITSSHFDSLQRDILKKFDQIKTLINSNPILNQVIDHFNVLEGKIKTYLQQILTDEMGKVKDLLKTPVVGTGTTTMSCTEDIIEPTLSKLLDGYTQKNLEQLKDIIGNLEIIMKSFVKDDVNDLKTTINQITSLVDQKIILSSEEIKEEFSRLVSEIKTNINFDGIIQTLNDVKSRIEQPDTNIADILKDLGITKSETFALTQNFGKLINLVDEIKTQVEKPPNQDTRIIDILNILNDSKIESSQLKSNIKQVIDLIDIIKTSIETPSKQVAQIFKDVNISKTETLEIKQKLQDFKTIAEKPLNDMSVIKDILEPAKELFDIQKMNNLFSNLKLLLDSEKNIQNYVQKQLLDSEKNIKNYFEKHMQTPISNIGSILLNIKNLKLYSLSSIKTHIDNKEKALKNYCNDLFADPQPFRYIKYINNIISNIYDLNLPTDVSKVFFSLQKISIIFDDLENNLKSDFKLKQGDNLQWQHLLDKLIAVHKSILDQAIGIQLLNIINKVDVINGKVLDQSQFNTFLNSADSNFQDVKKTVTDLQPFISHLQSETSKEINNTYLSFKLMIQREMNDLRKYFDTQIASIKKSSP